jgi:hypothetical protein
LRLPIPFELTPVFQIFKEASRNFESTFQHERSKKKLKTDLIFKAFKKLFIS